MQHFEIDEEENSLLRAVLKYEGEDSLEAGMLADPGKELAVAFYFVTDEDLKEE